MSNGEFTRIANPIYDGAFKYLLDDNKIARLFLSALIGREILDLDFHPTEHVVKLSQVDFTVFRMDFTARVQMEDGRDKLLLIEIQKAKLPQDVMRFRRYLGAQYSSPDNVVVREERSSTEALQPSGTMPAPATRYGKLSKPLEIFTIYFLGTTLLHTTEPVVWVRREVYGRDGDPTRLIEGPREEFIDSLSHDSIVVQIPYLKQRRRTDLEKLLAIFDQSQQLPGDTHILSLNAEEIPERYAKVVRRLVQAAAQPRVVEEMELEDTIILHFEEKERALAEALEREKLAIKREEEARQREEEERRLKEEALAELERLRRNQRRSEEP